MNRKKILIVVQGFSIGGIIVSLKSLLSMIDTSKYQIDIFALNRAGEYLCRLPNCTILPENLWLSHVTHTLGKFKNVINKGLRVLRAICRRIGYNIEPFMCKLADKQLKFDNYDTVVNYAESIAHITCHYPVKRKVAWIHCDFKRYLSIVNRDESNIYRIFDKVVCVSDFAKGVFVECIPAMADKVVAIHNIIDVIGIRNEAKKPIDDTRYITDFFTIVSAGRLDPVKQFHLIPEIAAEIKQITDKPFVWYIIGGDNGDGKYLLNIQKKIDSLGVSQQVVLLGEKKNIYPYMANADLCVSTSVSESYPLVINEAKALGIPVVTNNFGSAKESVENGVDGWITSIEDEQMSSLIGKLIDFKLSLSKFGNSLDEKNKCILMSIYQVL